MSNSHLPAIVLANPGRDPTFACGPGVSPRWFHRRLPDYAPTPLHDLPRLSRKLRVARILVKDEATRLGLPAFKMLGASWAAFRSLSERLGKVPRDWETVADLAAMFSPLRPLTLATATEGNHGRAVARMARMLGFSAEIWVPSNTAEARMLAIESEGAAVHVAEGGYDQAVAAAAKSAGEGTMIISDTSWEGYDTVPKWVIEGYSTILEEVEEQCTSSNLPSPDVVIVPVGVGAFAAAVARKFCEPCRQRVHLVAAEPVDAACCQESAKAGEIVTLTEPQNSIMAGLNCGTPSPVAWPIVSRRFDCFVSINDDHALEAMRNLARNGVSAGESAAAPLAALEIMQERGSIEDAASKTALLFSTEGATNPDFYALEVTAKL